MTKQVLGAALMLPLMVTCALADAGTTAQLSSDLTLTPLFYAHAPLHVVMANTPYALPLVPLLSANRVDVLNIISAMRDQLADFGSLAMDNGISQTADAFVDHWALAVDNNVAAQSASLLVMIDDMANQNSFLIQEFLQTPSIPIGDSLFSDVSFRDSFVSVPTGGFFEE